MHKTEDVCFVTFVCLFERETERESSPTETERVHLAYLHELNPIINPPKKNITNTLNMKLRDISKTYV